MAQFPFCLSRSWCLVSLVTAFKWKADLEDSIVIKFATKEDVCKYLETKYQDYAGEGLAKPFIMDSKWAEISAEDERQRVRI